MFRLSFMLANWPLFAIGLPIVVSVWFDFLTVCLEFLDDWRKG